MPNAISIFLERGLSLIQLLPLQAVRDLLATRGETLGSKSIGLKDLKKIVKEIALAEGAAAQEEEGKVGGSNHFHPPCPFHYG